MAKPAKRRIEGASSADDGEATAADAPAKEKETVPTSVSRSARVEAKATARTTPKGTKPGANKGASGRYTPPTPTAKYDMPSPMWVPVLMFSFFGIGLVGIFLNYTEVLPGSPSQWYLLGGLAAILAGIITATQLR